MRGYRGFTRSGNVKQGRSGARRRRIVERAEKDGWVQRAYKVHVQYERWHKSFRNVMVVDDGATYYVMDRTPVIHKGGKP